MVGGQPPPLYDARSSSEQPTAARTEPAAARPVVPMPTKPRLEMDQASMALFVDTEPKKEKPAPSATSQVPAAAIASVELPTPIVIATNPYGHAPMQMMSMPPMGVLGGAEEADAARREARKVALAGKLCKMSGIASGKSRFGSRWQARHFVLAESRVAYGDLASDKQQPVDAVSAFTGTKKSFSIWGSYVVPEPPERASGREHAFAVYRSDEDAFAGASISTRPTEGQEREQLLLLAADDAPARSRWVCALMAAAGRPGVLLRVGEDAAAVRLRVCYGSSPLDFQAGAANRHVLVRKVSKASGMGSIGVRVGDELVSVNGAPVPLLPASAVRRMLEAVTRPLELEIRRSRDATTAKELAAEAVLSLGTDPDDDVERDKRMRESLQVGEALRADRNAREAERAKRVAAAGVEAAAVGDAVARSEAELEARRAFDEAVETVRSALAASRHGDRLFQSSDYVAAAKAYRAALDSLMSVREVLADPAGPGRQALNRAIPDLSLAELFDHINSSGQEAANRANASVETLTSDVSRVSLVQAAAPPQAAAAAAAPETQPTTTTNSASALFDYASQADWQLDLASGDRLLVISEHDDGWSEVCLAHDAQARGLVPSSYIQVEGRRQRV